VGPSALKTESDRPGRRRVIKKDQRNGSGWGSSGSMRERPTRVENDFTVPSREPNLFGLSHADWPRNGHFPYAGGMDFSEGCVGEEIRSLRLVENKLVH